MVTVVDDSEKFSVNVVPDSHPETQGRFKRYVNNIYYLTFKIIIEFINF